MKTNILTLAIVLTVGVILAGSLLAPVINDATTTETTLINNGYMRMSHYDTTEDVTLEWDPAAPTIFTVNGEDVPITLDSSLNNLSVTILGDTNWVVRLDLKSNGDVNRLSYIPSSGSAVNATVADNQSVSITMSGGSMSGTMGTTSISNTYSDIYAPTLDGEYVMKKSNESAYIHADSFIFAYGLTFIGAATLGIEISGDYEDGVTSSVWRGATNFEISDLTINATPNSKYVGTYDLQNITLNATKLDTSEVTAVTYSYFLVPYEVTSELSQHLSDGEIAILKALPILIIAALVVMAAGSLYLKRDD